MKRFLCLMLVMFCVAGMCGMNVKAADTETEKMTLPELLERLCTGFPYVGYEKYPEVPQYFQDDYPDVPYGGYWDTVKTHGCGITVLAMMASYYTETEYLPDAFAERYRRYGSEAGTEFALFVDGPSEFGFPLVKRTQSWREAYAALGEGKMVVNLQMAGHFTTTAHFILLTGLTEDGKVLVRDPSYRNHEKRFAGKDYFVTGFDPGYVAAYGKFYWIYDGKVVRFSGCDRCEDPTLEHVEVFLEPYYCKNCAALRAKQHTYHEMMGIFGGRQRMELPA